MLFALLALMVAGVRGQTVGSLIGEFKWFSCQAKGSNSREHTKCDGPEIKDWQCVIESSYTNLDSRNANEEVSINQRKGRCLLKSKQGKYVFGASVEDDVRYWDGRFFYPVCEFKCEKKRINTFLN